MVCSDCWQKLNFIMDPFCEKCSAPLGMVGESCFSCHKKDFAFDSARAALLYDDISKKLIMRFKHHGYTHYSRLFAPWMLKASRDFVQHDMIVPVPLHPIRLFKRGFNQSAYLVKAMQHHGGGTQFLNIQVMSNALVRVRNTPAQGHKNPAERSSNVDGAFAANLNLVAGKSILLVDDVMTTGASLHHCAAALKSAGAIRVDVLVLARAKRGN